MLAFFYRKFGKVTKKGVIAFLLKRLPIYVIGLFILTVWGVKGVVITFFLVLAFFLGWVTNKMVAAVKDYRLTLRLNRNHFTTLEYDTMKRERDLALKAFQMIQGERPVGVKQGGGPAMPRPTVSRQLDPDEIREYVRQHAAEGESF